MDITLVRTLAGLPPGSAVPIVSVPGDQFPTLRGDPGYYTTPSGKAVVRHPNAYGGHTVYHPPTRRVEVGKEFSLDEWQIDETDGVKTAICLARAAGHLDVSVVPCRGPFTGWLCRRGDRTFHTRANSARAAISLAVRAWADQDKAALQARASALSGWCARAVPVTLYASELVGNCHAGSVAFARQHRLPLRGVPAARVLALAPDNVRARNAVAMAARLMDCCPTV